MSTLRPAVLIGCLGLGLGGCTVTPVSSGTAHKTPAAWYAPLPHDGSLGDMTQWWKQYDDPVLSELITLAEKDSPSLAKAWANIEAARASVASARSSGLPSLAASGSISRGTQETDTQQTQDAATAVSTTRSAGADASWEIDLFGKVRRGVEAARARVEARIDDWHDARVSLAAEVADTYVQYRACLLLADAYEREASSVAQTLSATEASVRAGFRAPADGALARASLATTRSSLTSQRAECELQVKSLVHLTGDPEPELRALLDRGENEVPAPAALEVRSLPADVLRQRPDVASSERELAAAGADIGIARADLYPSLSLSGSITASAGNALGTSSFTTWSFGPSLSIPLFDGGKRRAALDSARASYAAALAAHQQSLRDAVNEVERALVSLDSTARRTAEAQRAAQEYRRYFEAIEINWRAGRESLLTLEEARRSAVSAEIEYIGLQRDRVSHWISLYKALGGGWQPGTPASSPEAMVAR